MTRRQWLKSSGRIAFSIPIVSATGCEKKEILASAVVLETAGGLIIQIPHPIASVVGVVLIAGGAALLVTVILQDGTEETQSVPLNHTQKEKAEKEDVEVKGNNGKGEKVTPKKQ